MKTLKSYVCEAWYEAPEGHVPLRDPSTEEVIAQASTAGLDFAATLNHARTVGGSSLRKLDVAERGQVLNAMSKALHACRDELIDLSMKNTGVTRKDAKFDLDGATGTLAYYGHLSKELGGEMILDGEGVALGRSARFWGQHVKIPLRGAALLINAFNFPAWGFAEKAACAYLAGVPVIIKPATSTAMVAERCVEILVEAGVVPEGALSFVCGSTGDLVDRLGSQDVLAFTGSAETALALRSRPNLLASSTRVNIEADSLNAAVLGPDVEPGSESWNLFLRDVSLEMTQKTGQKCTAVRRVLVPAGRMGEVAEALGERLGAVVAGDPRHDSVTMGPLATADQLADTLEGMARLTESARIVHGTGERIDGLGAVAGKGYFFGPVLVQADDARKAQAVHEREVFGPVSTLLPYDGKAVEAAALVGLGGGCLVTSIYSDDQAWVEEIVPVAGSWSGRLYLGSTKMAAQAPSSGVALPQSMHGGPGRAGGGEELGALRGLDLYLHRAALQGGRSMITRLSGAKGDT